MLDYTHLKRNPRKFLALTGLTVKEFKALLPAFSEAYRTKYAGDKTLAKRKRKRQVGGGRIGQLNSAEQKLLFILVHQKTYPLQVVLGALFGLSQSSANEWIHRLLPILREALIALGVMPERDGRKFAQSERRTRESADYIIDGTERRRQRPKEPKKQALHYSGKKKMHTDKNVIIVHTRSKRVGYLSSTQAGKTHDKKVADREQIAYPRQATLRQDTGFQGYAPKVKHSYQPKKSQRAKS
jgi:Helix-turn-helix of DDE superfamily endonuclease/DDE superfamily endonuclease